MVHSLSGSLLEFLATLMVKMLSPVTACACSLSSFCFAPVKESGFVFLVPCLDR